MSAKSATGSNPVRPARIGALRRCGGKGRRPWEPHKLQNAGSIPASATRSRFVQWKDGGLTRRSRGFDSLTGYQIHGSMRPASWCGHSARLKPERTWFDSTAGHHARTLRRLMQETSGLRTRQWRLESSRGDQPSKTRHHGEERTSRESSALLTRRGPKRPREFESLPLRQFGGLAQLVGHPVRSGARRRRAGSSPAPSSI